MRAAQRFRRIVETHEACVIGRDADGQRALCAHRAALVVRQREDAREFFERADAGAHLPAPVVPLGGRRAGIEAAIESSGLGINRKAKQRLAGWSLLRATEARLLPEDEGRQRPRASSFTHGP